MSFTATDPKLAESCGWKETEFFLPWQLLAYLATYKLQAPPECLRNVVAQWPDYSIPEAVISPGAPLYTSYSLIPCQIALVPCLCSFSVAVSLPSHLRTVHIMLNTKG